MNDICVQIKKEIEAYETESKEIVPGYSFSAYNLIRRIMLYKNKIYPTGKFDSQGNYKYWFDIITPRCQSEIKNIDFDTKDISLYSESKNDMTRVMLADIALKRWLKDTGQAEKLNEAVEIGTEFGNVVWKKIKNDYDVMQLSNLMVLNTTAKTLEDSDVIESDIMLSSDLRKKMDIWDNVDELIKSAPSNETPEFFIYERNGEVSEKDYFEAKKIGSDGKEDKFILTKIIVGGVKKGKPTQILFCDEINKMPYKEYHRSSFSGRWLRVGMYETLLDIQVRANEIGNQIARGLEWASKIIFTGEDNLIVQNITTDLVNGDYVRSKDLHQVDVRLQGLDQLIVDWNRLMELANKLANSYEVVTGETMGSNMPFRLGAMMNQNAGKLFDFIREKLGIVFQEVIEDWILPNMLKDLKGQEVLKLTADTGILNQYYEAVVDDWYIKNLAFFPPHNEEQAKEIKADKLKELLLKKEANVELSREMWADFYPRCKVNIVGENYNLMEELETLQTFIALEQDPIRRTALIEIAMGKKGIDSSSLPKTEIPEPEEGMGELEGLINQQLQGFTKNKGRKKE